MCHLKLAVPSASSQSSAEYCGRVSGLANAPVLVHAKGAKQCGSDTGIALFDRQRGVINSRMVPSIPRQRFIFASTSWRTSPPPCRWYSMRRTAGIDVTERIARAYRTNRAQRALSLLRPCWHVFSPSSFAFSASDSQLLDDTSALHRQSGLRLPALWVASFFNLRFVVKDGTVIVAIRFAFGFRVVSVRLVANLPVAPEPNSSPSHRVPLSLCIKGQGVSPAHSCDRNSRRRVPGHADKY